MHPNVAHALSVYIYYISSIHALRHVTEILTCETTVEPLIDQTVKTG